MQVYKLSKPMLFFLLTTVAFIVLLGLAILIPALLSPAGARQPHRLWFTLVWCGFLGWIWYAYLRIPYTITWRDDDSLEFRSLIGRTQVPVRQIISLKATPFTVGFISVKHQQGSLRIMSRMTGLYELIGRVKALNPEVEIKGC
jgi:hypothetical protein